MGYLNRSKFQYCTVSFETKVVFSWLLQTKITTMSNIINIINLTTQRDNGIIIWKVGGIEFRLVLVTWTRQELSKAKPCESNSGLLLSLLLGISADFLSKSV